MSAHRACPYHDDAEIERPGVAFLDRTLPKAEWTHTGHFAAALWLLATRPAAEVRQAMPGRIRAYNLAAGGTNTDTAGYHETITQASLGAAADVARRHPQLGLVACCTTLLSECYGDPDWLLAYWSRDVLFSVAARRAWMPPDRASLPFAIAAPAPQSSR